MDMPAKRTLPLMISSSRVCLISGLNTLGVSFSRIDYAPGGLNPPHTHPCATEIAFMLEVQSTVNLISSFAYFVHGHQLDHFLVTYIPVSLLQGRVSVADIIGFTGSDLIASKVDGSAKSWDNSMDLINVLKHDIRDGQLSFRGKRVLEGGIYTLPNHLSPDARDLIPRMLVVDPMKRVTILDIRSQLFPKNALMFVIKILQILGLAFAVRRQYLYS